MRFKEKRGENFSIWMREGGEKHVFLKVAQRPELIITGIFSIFFREVHSGPENTSSSKVDGGIVLMMLRKEKIFLAMFRRGHVDERNSKGRIQGNSLGYLLNYMII
jgi:hypothetical protein